MGKLPERRRTGFERDLREFVLKLVLGLALGFVLMLVIDWNGPGWVPYAVGVFGSFAFAYGIRGSSAHQDDR